jgi:hypothetical protein
MPQEPINQEHSRFRHKDTIEINLVRQLASIEWRKRRWETLENIILGRETGAQEAGRLATRGLNYILLVTAGESTAHDLALQ